MLKTVKHYDYEKAQVRNYANINNDSTIFLSYSRDHFQRQKNTIKLQGVNSGGKISRESIVERVPSVVRSIDSINRRTGADDNRNKFDARSVACEENVREKGDAGHGLPARYWCRIYEVSLRSRNVRSARVAKPLPTSRNLFIFHPADSIVHRSRHEIGLAAITRFALHDNT